MNRGAALDAIQGASMKKSKKKGPTIGIDPPERGGGLF